VKSDSEEFAAALHLLTIKDSLLTIRLSERISDGEVERLHILETSEIEIAVAIRVEAGLRIVEGEAPVDTDDEESQIIAQADARADGNIVEEA